MFPITPLRCNASFLGRFVPKTRFVHQSTTSSAELNQDIEPPFKKHRDPTSVLRALASCVQPNADAPDFRIGGDPWLGSTYHLKPYLLAKAKGRLAARLAIRDYFPNDIVGVAKELPRIERLLPLITPNDVLKRQSEGSLSPVEAMDRLILLLAPQHAWKLYSELAPEEDWSDVILHRLLDLLCATNSGLSEHQVLPPNADLSSLPDSEELYFKHELSSFTGTTGDAKVEPGSTIEAATDSPEADEVEKDSDTPELADEALEASPVGVWSVHGPAEQLFQKQREKLQTPAAYCSMIRGASRFQNPTRALQLAEEAWGLSEGDACLDAITYSALVRSLCHLDEPNIWPLTRSILERFVSSKQTPTIELFCSIFYALAESTIKLNKFPPSVGSISEIMQQYVTIGLGLLEELRQLGLEPSLGVMANMLKIVHFAHPSYSHLKSTSSSSTEFYGYSGSALVESFVDELEYRFKNIRAPSRSDQWTMDDFTFFPIAMRIASSEYSLDLGNKINHLLVGSEDRRFFLSTSQQKRAYVVSYALLVMSYVPGDREDPYRVSERLEVLYRTHWDVILSTSKLMGRMVSLLGGLLSSFSEQDKLNNVTLLNEDAQRNKLADAKTAAYRCLSRLFMDMLDHFRLSADFRTKKTTPVLVKLLIDHSSIAPQLAVSTSAHVLSRFKYLSAKAALDASKFTSATAPPKQAYNDPLFIQDMIQLAFPAAVQVIRSGGSIVDVSKAQQLITRRALTTLHDWFLYAIEQKAVSWNWAPSMIGFLFEQDLDLNENDLWEFLLQLSTAPFTPRNKTEVDHVSDLLSPLLAALEPPESSKTSTGLITAQQHQHLLATIRRILKAAHENAPEPKDQDNSVEFEHTSPDRKANART